MCLYLWPRTQEVRVDCELLGVTPGSCICFTLEAVLEGAAQVKPDRLENQIGGSRFFRVCQNDFKSRSVRVALLWEFQIGLITRSGASSRSKRLPDRTFYIFDARSQSIPDRVFSPDRLRIPIASETHWDLRTLLHCFGVALSIQIVLFSRSTMMTCG